MLIIITVYFILPYLVVGQNTFSAAIPYRSANSCNPQQYFNSITLSCINCPSGQIPNVKRDACQCELGSRITGWSSALQCAPCTGGLAVSQDNWNCVSCRSATNATLRPDTETGQCPPCEINQITELDVNSGANQVLVEKCVNCPEGTQPNKDKSKCEACTTSACFCQANPTICTAPQSNSSRLGVITLENNQLFRSNYILENLAFAEAQCRSGESKECQHLANMCVLQNFDTSADGACAMLESILRTTINGQIMVPTLFYYNTEAPIELSRENAIEATFNVELENPNTYLDIISIMYFLNGSFIGLQEIGDGLLQLCPTERKALDGTYLFGREYRQECLLKLSDVVERITMKRKYNLGEQTTVFHELYLRYIDNNNQQMMYPIPVINENIRQSNQFVNRLDTDNRWMLTRRFYLLDSQPEATSSGRGILTRVPSHVSIHIQAQLSRDGRIFPPYLRIKHSEFHALANETIIKRNSQTFTSTFQINYSIDSRRHDKTIEVLMAVFCSTSVLWGALRAYAWVMFYK